MNSHGPVHRLEAFPVANKDALISNLVEVVAKNLGAIVWKWIKNKFQKK